MCRWSTLFLFAALGFSQTTLVRTTRLLDVKSGRYLTDQGILIREGIISQVGPFDAVRAAAAGDPSAIDLSGLTVLPGLIDCHTHLLIAAPEKMNAPDALILTIAKLSPMKRALLGAQLAREALEAGFTMVRNVGHLGVDGDAVPCATQSTTTGFRGRAFWRRRARSRRRADRRSRCKARCWTRS